MKELLDKIIKDKELVDKFKLLYDLSIDLELEIRDKFNYDADNYGEIRKISHEIMRIVEE